MTEFAAGLAHALFRTVLGSALALGLTCVLAQEPKSLLAPPDTPISATVEWRFGRTIHDPYRWLENTGAADVMAWFRAQNEHTHNVLDALPGRAALHARLVEINRNVTHVRDMQTAGDTLVYLKRAPEDVAFRLYLREGQIGAERLLLDPVRYNKDGQAASIEYFSVSPNGKRLAVGVALGGNEDATLHLLDVATLREIAAPIPRARGADPVWRYDGEVLFYTQLRERKEGESRADAEPGSSRIHAHIRLGWRSPGRSDLRWWSRSEDCIRRRRHSLGSRFTRVALRYRRRESRCPERNVDLCRAAHAVARCHHVMAQVSGHREWHHRFRPARRMDLFADARERIALPDRALVTARSASLRAG